MLAWLSDIPSLDALLQSHAAELGGDFNGYRNHCYRVLNLCVHFSADGPSRLEKIAVAVAFHDMGIWTHRTFDYLQPSAELATAYLRDSGDQAWTTEITEMILEHHKVSPYRRDLCSLVEPFRRADWVDVSRGLMAFGLPRGLLKDLFAMWPSAGFHKRLVQLSLGRLLKHPLNPLPMMRL